MANPRKARIIGDRYQLGRVIGRGGMATIHEAMDLRLERPVAVKLLRPEAAADADLADRFRREALAATVLRHPNIVACLDTGTDDGQPYLVMDLVDGEDLAARLKRGGRLAPTHAARIGLDVARALGVAHVRGIVHRDVKPGNILLASDGRAMVTDFGIARLAADAEAARPGTTLGSVHYFSPEQAKGATTTPASDVYGLGLVLYEAMTGARAFGGETTDAIALARIGATPPSPRSIRPEVPVDLDAVVRRALAPEPADRYANGNAMATALEAAMQTADDASPTTIVSTPVVADVPPEPSTHPERPARARPRTTAAPRSRRQGRGPSAPSGVLIALLALIGIVGGAIAVAALAGGSRTLDSGSPASEAAVETPTRTPKPTPTPSPTPSPTPKPTPSATPTPSPTPVAEGATADLCEIFFDIPCGLGAGRYAPSRFRPAFDIELGDGWSNAAHREDIVVLTRPEGTLTFAGGLRQVFPRGKPGEPSTHARDLMESFIATDGVGATKPKGIRIDRRRAYSSDLQPVGRTRVPLFSTDGSTFNLEPDRTTRIVVVDLPGDDTIVFAIEPSDGYELRDILETADPVAGSINWR
ncbi:MAG TPA: protein kinase [Patescibacteria group bacterium]|nr:protein kinase [Patescibacteria group bacterium]